MDDANWAVESDGIRYTRAEWEEKKQRDEQQKWAASTLGQAFKQLGEAYMTCKAWLGEDPYWEREAARFDEVNQKLFNRLRTNIERANNAPRCAHIMVAGNRCRAPKMRGKKYCHMHLAFAQARPEKIDLPSLDDPNGIQLAIARAAQALVDGKLDQKQASLLGYYLQLAVSNVGRVDFEEGWEPDEDENED